MRKDGYPEGKTSYLVVVALTLFPYTDMLGVNFFYMGRRKLGWAKIISWGLVILASPTIWGAIGVLGLIILWWLLDIVLVTPGIISPRWEEE